MRLVRPSDITMVRKVAMVVLSNVRVQFVVCELLKSWCLHEVADSISAPWYSYFCGNTVWAGYGSCYSHGSLLYAELLGWLVITLTYDERFLDATRETLETWESQLFEKSWIGIALNTMCELRQPRSVLCPTSTTVGTFLRTKNRIWRGLKKLHKRNRKF